jgi:hypothetical protein
MNSQEAFTDACALAAAIGAGKISLFLAQAVPSDTWYSHLIGPGGALFTMAVCIWWLSRRNAVLDEREAKVTEARIESLKQITEALTKSTVIIEQNQEVLHSAADALKRHPCIHQPTDH